ncbi:FK506-binding protein 1-like protein [Leishmania tarentolae]|uniref:peptidylprolyl isomerase n=1 Tax=Leishmania tarentolae TaxID=5689 RepID=A0A640KBP9_LEITA|nr:FK506-binding protein 1-like protein [Leishmania tarentolae]
MRVSRPPRMPPSLTCLPAISSCHLPRVYPSSSQISPRVPVRASTFRRHRQEHQQYKLPSRPHHVTVTVSVSLSLSFSSHCIQKMNAADQAFMASLDAKPGVHQLPSGMRFKVLKKVVDTASTKSPNVSDACSVHYHGTLTSGKVFDSSMDRGHPTTFAPNQVIKGWTEALQYMVEGEEWEVYLPPDLAYGTRGAGGVIPPNAALVFKIHLLKVLQGGKAGADGHKKLEQALSKTYAEL